MQTFQAGLCDEFHGIFRAVDLRDHFRQFDDRIVLGAILLEKLFDLPILIFLDPEIGGDLRVDDAEQRREDGQLEVVRSEIDGDEIGLGDLFADPLLKLGILRIGQRLAVCHALRQRFGKFAVLVVIGRVERLAQFRGPPAAVGLVVIVLVVLVDTDALGNEVRISADDTLSFRGTAFFRDIKVGLDAITRGHAVTEEGVGFILLLVRGERRDADGSQRHDERKQDCKDPSGLFHMITPFPLKGIIYIWIIACFSLHFL